MAHTRVSSKEIAQLGRQLYDQRIRALVETEENIGRIVVIDVETGDYEVAEEGLTAGHRLQQRHPDAAMLCLRIGYNAVYSFGGVLTRTKE